ncbi:MAG: hypothetical protein AB3N22_21360 [Ruegeria sp.]
MEGVDLAAYQVEGKELKKLVNFAKEKTVAFAFNPGAKEDEHYFGLDRKKPAKLIAKEAKVVGSGKKVAFGEMNVVGKEMRLTCERELPAMAKTLKKWLKKQKLTLNVVIMDPEGNILDSDIDDDLQDGAEAGGDSNTPDIDDAGAVEQKDKADASVVLSRIKIISGRIKALPRESAADFAKPFKTIAKLAQSGNIKGAALGADKLEAALGKLEKALNQKATDDSSPPEAAPDPNKAKWVAHFPKIDAAVKDARAQGGKANPDHPDLVKLNRLWNLANETVGGDAPNYAKAMATLPSIVDLIKKVRSAQDTGPKVDPEVKPFDDARLTWQGARKTLESELKKLQSEIIKVCKGTPELAGIVQNVGSLSDHVAGLDARLESALAKIVDAEAGDARNKRKIAAMGIVKEYRSNLNSGFFKHVDTGNGFTDVQVAKTAHEALDKIARVLA